MEQLTICYEFSFNIALCRSNGRTQGNHSIIATGSDYRNAVWDMYFTLKKRRSTLIRVNSVRVLRIAFALDEEHRYTTVRYTDYPVQIPEDLNKDVASLPKNGTL